MRGSTENDWGCSRVVGWKRGETSRSFQVSWLGDVRAEGRSVSWESEEMKSLESRGGLEGK